MTDATPIEIHDDSVVGVSSRQISSAMGAEQAILQLDSGKYFGLNPVGARIWQLAAEPRKVGDILATLLAEYEVPADRCRADLLAVLHQLHAAGLIEVRNS